MGCGASAAGGGGGYEKVQVASKLEEPVAAPAPPDIVEVAGPPQIGKPEVSTSSEVYSRRPYVDGAKRLVNGRVCPWEGPCADVVSPLFEAETGHPIVIGRQATLTPVEAQEACDAAAAAWDRGRGTWPNRTLEQRIAAIEALVAKLQQVRADIVNVLQWEICKNDADAAKEFDRTMEYIAASIATVRRFAKDGRLNTDGVYAEVRRSPVGVMMNFGPLNYPFNETYATLIPALLVGNCVVMKIPNTGGLAHFLTMDAYAECFPPGVVNFVSGRGRDTMPPVMGTGKVDLLAFVGSSKTADSVVRYHPQPHRLRTLLSLDGKNLGIVLPDADLNVAARECLVGSTSYNGQRCTAIKLIMVHSSIVEEFNTKFSRLVNGLIAGAPFGSASITPLPLPDKPEYLNGLVEDAKAHGAAVINECGGQFDRSLYFPAVVYPVTSEMKLWTEEQFGPVIPIARYESMEEVYSYLKATPSGQQVSVFTSFHGAGAGGAQAPQLAELIDVCALSTCRVNINTQCQRGPDNYPFAGRRSSALGTVSVSEVLRAVSVETMVASKQPAAIAHVCASSSVFA